MIHHLVDPFIAFLLRKLGDLLRRRGLEGFALHCYAQARSFDPHSADSLYAEARACWEAGDHAAAGALLQGLLSRDPGHAQGRNLLGAIQFAAEDFAAAEVLFRQAIDLAPGLSAAHNNLGNIFVEREEFTAAEPHYRAALACDPEYVEALSNLAMILNRQGRHEEAEALCRRALLLRPQFAGALNNLANILLDQDRRGEAIECYRAALREQPDLPEAHLNLAVTLADPDQLRGSLDHYRRVLERRPDSYIAHLRIGTALQVMGDWAGSERHLESAEGLRPAAMEVPHLRGNNASLMGDYQRADKYFRRALLLGAGSSTHGSYLFNLLYDPECGPLDFLREARDWAILYAESGLPIPARGAADATGRRLRIGYLSKDFGRHSVAYFIEPVIARHDRSRFEIFCYSNNPKPDAVTERFEELAEHWRDVAFVPDEEAWRQITADGIDILVDLSGHTGGNRRHLLARKPAPVQVNYLGYPATMAMSAIAYRIVDAITDPPGEADAAHTEALVRLPGCFLTYLPTQDPPAVARPPAAVRGHITFG
ncbi:MAG: tetratricopeptide repeat protein, partial [Burkholderiales bacterium]